MSHKIESEYLPMFRRYQCRICKSWIRYSEEDGKWHHRNG